MSLRKVLMLTRAWDFTVDVKTVLAHLDDGDDDDVMRHQPRPRRRIVRPPATSKERTWRWRPHALTE